MSTPIVLIASLAFTQITTAQADTPPLLDEAPQVTAPATQTPTPPAPPSPPLAQHWPAAITALGRYEALRQSIKTTARTPAHSAQGVETVMVELASYDGKVLANAWIAQAIRTAAQSQDFRQGVNTWAKTYGPGVVLGWLRQNPGYVMTVPGHDDAVTRVLRSAQNDAQEIQLAAGIYHDLAYSTQHENWAKKINHGKSMQLALLRDAPASQTPLSPALLQSIATRKVPEAIEDKPLYTGIWYLPGLNFAAKEKKELPEPEAIAPAPALNTQYNRDMALVLSTLAIAYLRHPASTGTIDTNTLPLPASTSTKLAECVDWAHMHLNQCVAATHFIYENLFCIAEHQLKDLGLCIGNMASASAPKTSAPMVIADTKPAVITTKDTDGDFAADDDFSEDDFTALNASADKEIGQN